MWGLKIQIDLEYMTTAQSGGMDKLNGTDTLVCTLNVNGLNIKS